MASSRTRVVVDRAEVRSERRGCEGPGVALPGVTVGVAVEREMEDPEIVGNRGAVLRGRGAAGAATDLLRDRDRERGPAVCLVKV